MSSDPNKKSARTFQCRDVLWETFEQMARELECSVDYLINEAMKQYARQRSYGSRTPFPVQGRGVEAQSAPAMPSSEHRNNYASPPSNLPPSPSGAPASMRGGLPAPSRGGAPMSGGRGSLPVPPTGGSMRPGGLPVPPPRGGGLPMPPPAGRTAPPPPNRSVPPPIPRGGTPLPPIPQSALQAPPVANGFPAPAQQQHGSQLSIVYQGEKLPVNKDRFVIGRGKQSSDLTLKDPNVSRQHAMIEFQNGVYFMVDMGSTNGVEYNGQRIARKQISEGDVFRICDHDLVFTYR